ncbi:nitroreductase family protein [Eubacteriaceae bacterium ES3]|nr:nitroreductase family protein [Eubacteriaceae bacterium ES3]
MFNELAKSRRSIRKFKKQSVESGKIQELLNAALMAPSSRSRCPWEFIVIDDQDVLSKLSTCREHGASFLENAPLAVAVIADIEKTDVWVEDTSIAATYIQLAAHDLGLGSCWIQVRNRYYSETVETQDFIRETLGIPKEFAVECILAVGYADEEKSPHDEASLQWNKVRYNSYEDKYKRTEQN